MINISKQFAAWVTASQQDKFRLATLKLTFFYVFSTAVILFVSSIAILFIFAPAETELPFRIEEKRIEIEHGDWSVYELREHLVAVVTFVDVVILLIVGAFAHLVARRTLLPIKHMHEAQQRFMSDAAHELRTPLSVMQIGADTILRQKRSREEYEDFVTDVQDEAGRLTRLSNQLLQLLKTDEAGKVLCVEEDISKILETEIKRFTPYAKEHSVTIISKVVPGVSINTEKDSLIEVVQNLLKNAIVYNKPNGQVTVSLIAERDFVQLIMQDTGVGIPLNKQSSIFDRFTKVDSARTPYTESGAGLGLAIVKALVTKLRGKISLESTEGIGTSIVITLPITHS